MSMRHKRGRYSPRAVVGSVAVEGKGSHSLCGLVVAKRCIRFGATALFIVCIQRWRHKEVPLALLCEILQRHSLTHRGAPLAFIVGERWRRIESQQCVSVAHIQVLEVYVEVVFLRETVLCSSPSHFTVVVPKVRLNTLSVSIDIQIVVCVVIV